ncbi:hypothetical protein ACNFJ7_08090 [Sphingomonas sp. HT-1]|uniref:hypothetical protein n=1 Tax=unclassified Sphingomonas TaxID=196159 RepID=UPI000AB5B76B|nr:MULTISPECIES: hypothetical protein [unclassified Sphingomonas]
MRRIGALTGTVAAITWLCSATPAGAVEIDWVGFENCIFSCYEAFPGRERDCDFSCQKAFGIDTGEGYTGDGRGTEIDIPWYVPIVKCGDSTLVGLCSSA